MIGYWWIQSYPLSRDRERDLIRDMAKGDDPGGAWEAIGVCKPHRCGFITDGPSQCVAGMVLHMRYVKQQNRVCYFCYVIFWKCVLCSYIHFTIMFRRHHCLGEKICTFIHSLWGKCVHSLNENTYFINNF